jgi:hypothetical protein
MVPTRITAAKPETNTTAGLRAVRREATGGLTIMLVPRWSIARRSREHILDHGYMAGPIAVLKSQTEREDSLA